MKKFWKEFLLRGLICAAGGPLVLAIIYGILGTTGTVAYLSPSEVCMGILTITLLAFTAAGMTAIYQIEQLPLLLRQLTPILIFTGIFLAGYALIWLIIYWVEKNKAEKLNKMLKD